MGHIAEIRSGSAIGTAQALRVRVVLAVMLIAQAPDGRITPDGLARVARVCRGAPVLAGLDAAGFQEMAGITLRALAARGPDRVLADLRGQMPRALAECALAMAVRASFDAGRLPPDTAGILGGLATHLGVPAAQLSDLFEVMGTLERVFDVGA